MLVLDAARCGDGASARNGGFMHGYWASLPRLVHLFGADRAVALAREATGVYDAVRALGEDVWLNDSGMLTVALGPALPRILSGKADAVAMTNIAQFGVRGFPEFESMYTSAFEASKILKSRWRPIPAACERWELWAKVGDGMKG